ncbi:hypothetical protein R4227_20030 [Gordonia amicalis]|uniref:hypothetical protein n=1 Tax=Gordonia amicalis TaxID=89053 RepID=UPI00295441BD|nr:hypothetical protein [Gordonia amicalis]MDV7102341.1 hypothetical protein [Gordonia amicalis]
MTNSAIVFHGSERFETTQSHTFSSIVVGDRNIGPTFLSSGVPVARPTLTAPTLARHRNRSTDRRRAPRDLAKPDAQAVFKCATRGETDEAKMGKQSGLGEMLKMSPMMVKGLSDADRQAVFARLPGILKLLIKLGGPRFRRLDGRAFYYLDR